MRVIVYAQDLSGRRDDGYYTKPDIGAALDLFFQPDGTKVFADPDGEDEISRDFAEQMFKADRRVEFFNEASEKTVITAELSE